VLRQLAVINGLRCKLARSYGVLSLIYVPTEANIPILEAGRNLKNPERGYPTPCLSIEPLPSRAFQPCRDLCGFHFYKIKNSRWIGTPDY